MSSAWALFAYANVALAAFCIVFVTYRVFFHPLAKVPGPLANKISCWPHFLATQAGRRHVWLFELHQTYGPVVRISPDKISMNRATALKEIYGSRKASIKKGEFYQAVLTAEGAQTTFTTRDESVHKLKRRMLSHAFSERAIQDSEQFVSSNVNVWLDQLGAGPLSKDGWTSAKNVATWINYLTFDILTDLAYGRSFGLLTKTDMRYVAELVPNATFGVYAIAQHPFTRFMRWFAYRTPIGAWLGGELVTDMKRLTETTANFLAERRSLEVAGDEGSGPGRQDFFHHLFRGEDTETGQAYTPAELASESTLLLVAGSDTSATTLAATFFHLLRNPNVLKKLRKELDSNFSSIDELNYAGTPLAKLPYLRAVLDECMRLNPPVPGRLDRDVVGNGITIDDVFYPPGVEVGVSIYSLQHNTDYFSDPFAFKPERWIVDEKAGVTKEMVDQAHSAFAAFSIGHRGCIGKNLAYVELSLAIARCVWRFDMEEVANWDKELGGGFVSSTGEYTVHDGFVSRKNGPLVRFRERKR